VKKISKYTHITPYENQFIYYNAAKGMDSILLAKHDFRVESLEGIDGSMIDELQAKGHLVSSNDEDEVQIQNIQRRFDERDYLSLIILPNEECNFRCVYCYESLKHQVMREETILGILKYVENNISQYSSLQVAWFGGEPLLSLQTIINMSQAFISICREHKKGYVASVTTNGYLLDIETFQQLKKCNVTHYQITIDGCKAVHDIQRPLHNGRGTFEQIIQNLKMIKDNIHSHTFEIVLRTNCSKRHYDTFDEYLEVISKTFADDPRFSLLLRTVMDWGGERIDNYRDQMFEVQQLKGFLNTYMEKKEHALLPKHMMLLEPLSCVCYAGYKNTLVIDSAGSLFRCTCNFDNEESRIGYISNDGKLHIDETRLQLWNSNIHYRRSDCNLCELLPLCLGDPCPEYRIANKDSHA